MLRPNKKSCLCKIIHYIIEMVRWEPMGRVHQNGHGKEGSLDEMILLKSIY